MSATTAPLGIATKLGGGRARPLRVCMIHFSDFEVDSRIQRQARALAERGDEVDLVCLSKSGERQIGAGLIRLHNVGREKPNGGARQYLTSYARFFTRALAKVTSLETRRRFDIIEAHNMPDFLAFAAILPKLRGAPVILNLHDTFPELFETKFLGSSGGLAARLVYFQERRSARFASAVVTVTDEAADRLAARRVSAPRNVVVMNSPDDQLFGPQRAPVQRPPGGLAKAVYHGGLADRFGVELLIDAVGLLVDSHPFLSLRICGGGPEREALAKRAAALPVGRVELSPGSVPFEQIPRELEQAHIGIVPTRRDSFTELLLPVKLLEYVHMGLPAIAPRLPVIERYFTADEVMFFEPDSTQSLSEAIAATVVDPEAAVARAARAATRLSPFSWPTQKQRYLELVDNLTEARVRGRVSVRDNAGASSSRTG